MSIKSDYWEEKKMDYWTKSKVDRRELEQREALKQQMEYEIQRRGMINQEEYERKLIKYKKFIKYCRDNHPEVYFDYVMTHQLEELI